VAGKIDSSTNPKLLWKILLLPPDVGDFKMFLNHAVVFDFHLDFLFKSILGYCVETFPILL